MKQWHERERKTLLPLTVDFALGVIAIVPWKTKSSRLPNFEPKTLLRNSSLLEAGAQGYWRQHSLCFQIIRAAARLALTFAARYCRNVALQRSACSPLPLGGLTQF